MIATVQTLEQPQRRPLKMRAKTLIINWSASAMNWVVDHVHSDPCKSETGITWRDHLAWWLEDRLHTVFGWAWDGSDEELDAVHRDEIPPYAMSDRQRALVSPGDPVCCYPCRWDGALDECADGDECPYCGEHVQMNYTGPAAAPLNTEN